MLLKGLIPQCAFAETQWLSCAGFCVRGGALAYLTSPLLSGMEAVSTFPHL